jgi:hypothetical protein
MLWKNILTDMQKAILQPESLWVDKAAKDIDIKSFLQTMVLPVIAVVSVVSGVFTKILGYHIPVIGVIYPSWSDMVMQIIGTVILYIISIVILGWIAGYLAGIFGGKNDMGKALAMVFWISIPSLAGQVLGTLPYVGWIIALGLGLYSLVLLYKAIPLFLNVPLEERVKHFILFMIGAFVVSVLLNMSLGRLFTSENMIQNIQPDIVKEVNTPVVEHKTSEKKTVKPENPLEDYVKSMTKGDYNKEVVEATAQDTFTPPEDGKLRKEQVEQFLILAQKVKKVEQEQASKLKEKYEKKEKSDNFSISDFFNGLKDISNMATLELKVVKANGGNWAEYQWVKDRIREAYYTPSLSPITEYNAALLKGHEDILKEIL